MGQQATEAPAGLLVVSVDWEGGEIIALANPATLSEAVDVAQAAVRESDNPEAVFYVLPAIAAFRPTRD